VLVIRDGWGDRKDKKGNAILAANTPFTDHLLKTYPHTHLDAHGHAVGLGGSQAIGSSEVGHLNIGAGRIVKQLEVSISDAIATGEFNKNPAFVAAIDHVKKHNSRIHLMGLVQDAGVHADQEHLFALMKLCSASLSEQQILIHAFTDGRDTPPRSAKKYLDQLHGYTLLYPSTIATVMGRYYAMDRDKRWERTQMAYDGIVKGVGERVPDWERAVDSAYAQEQDDEFITPRILADYDGIHDNDAIIFFNYRLDRTRQLTLMLREATFDGVESVRRDYLDNIYYVAMSEYYSGMNAAIAFPNHPMENLLGKVLADNNLRQLRISETEKYAHVTYFFNGQVEEPNVGEDRKLIQSDKSVGTYDKAPAMKVHEIADALVSDLDKYDVVITNLVNADMVGHSGVFDATVQACEEVDSALKKITEAVLARGGVLLVTADHGNAEEMFGEDGSPKTAHTTHPVDLILVDDSGKYVLKQKMGKLGDIAPTLLARMGVEIPAEMTGENLLEIKH